MSASAEIESASKSLAREGGRTVGDWDEGDGAGGSSEAVAKRAAKGEGISGGARCERGKTHLTSFCIVSLVKPISLSKQMYLVG